MENRIFKNVFDVKKIAHNFLHIISNKNLKKCRNEFYKLYFVTKNNKNNTRNGEKLDSYNSSNATFYT